MQGVPIKFRGKNSFNGKLVYGDCVHQGEFVFIRYRADNNIYYADKVAPDSVAQLVGYDMDGEEVYEGDALLSFDNDTLTAACFSNADYKYYTIMKGNGDE